MYARSHTKQCKWHWSKCNLAVAEFVCWQIDFATRELNLKKRTVMQVVPPTRWLESPWIAFKSEPTPRTDAYFAGAGESTTTINAAGKKDPD
jgi:hypothetical protein